MMLTYLNIKEEKNYCARIKFYEDYSTDVIIMVSQTFFLENKC